MNALEISTNDHARILYAYIARLSQASLDDIYKTQKAAWHASINNGMSAQISAQNEAMLAVQAALGRMIDHDKDNLSKIIGSIA